MKRNYNKQIEELKNKINNLLEDKKTSYRNSSKGNTK